MGDQRDRQVSVRRVSRVSFVVVALVGMSVSVALAVGTGTVEPPPRFAFVATANNFPDALAVGPVAGQLRAPLFLTGPDSLDANARAGLQGESPEVVVIAGGEAAVSKAVEDEIAALLPGANVRRAAGANRTETAKLVSDIIREFNPAFLPVGATATDADLLDGKDSSAFLGTDGKAADADLLDGKDSTAFLDSSGKAVDADLLDGRDSTQVTGTFLMTGFGPTGFAWGQELELMRLIVPSGPKIAYDVEFRMEFRNPVTVTAAAGSLTCEVRSGSNITPAVEASTSEVPEFITLEAASEPLRPVPHIGGSLGVWCINTLEDGGGEPILLEWHGQLSHVRAEQVNLVDWLGELS